MSVRTAVFDRVTAESDITDVLGTSPTRFRWRNVPQGETPPYTRYFQVARDRKRGHDGPAGLSLADLQIEHYGADPDAVDALAETFIASLDGTNNGTVTMLLTNELDAFQIDTSLWQITQTWLAQWKES